MAASPPEPQPHAELVGTRRSRPIRPFRPRFVAAAVVLLTALLLALPAAAQEVVRPRLQGRVVRTGADTVGIPSVRVTLHMVTPDTAGEIDSLRAGPAGEFVFDLPTVPDPLGRGEVYFASVNHLGVMYFGPAVHQAVQLDSTYLVEVFDTTMVPEEGVNLTLALRYLILEPTVTEWLVTDVIQVENTGDRTLVAPEGEAVWRYPLPAGALDMQPGGGDASPESLQLRDGALEVTAPLTPGVRQYMVRYRLEQPRLDLRLPGTVRQVELLVREPAPLLAVTGLTENEPAEMEPGVIYRRFSAADARDGRILVLPGVPQREIPLPWLAVMMGLLLAAVTLWAVQRDDLLPAAAGGPDWVSAHERREALLLEVAEIDERLDAAQPGDTGRKDLTSRRRALLEEVRRLGRG